MNGNLQGAPKAFPPKVRVWQNCLVVVEAKLVVDKLVVDKLVVDKLVVDKLLVV